MLPPQPSLTAVERAAAQEPLDDEAATRLLESLFDGRCVVVSSTAVDARRVFLLRNAENASRSPLDARERQVARLVGRGRASKQIAHALGVSSSTVARAIDRCARVLGSDGRVDLAILVAALDRASQPGGHRAAHAFVGRSATLARAPGTTVLSVSLGVGPLWERLSAAERAVAALALAGHPSATIALRRGHRSERTVANQLACVFRKAGVSGRIELASRLLAG